MNTLVIYDSQYGNTERIARAIADVLHEYGKAEAMRVDPSHPIALEGVDMLLVGSPTQGWRPTQPIQSLIAGLSAASLRGVAVACFDTRFHKARWLTGSAAAVMAKRLRQADIGLLAPPESFFVEGSEGPLEHGEIDRAVAWAQLLAHEITVPHPAMQA